MLTLEQIFIMYSKPDFNDNKIINFKIENLKISHLDSKNLYNHIFY